MLKKRAVFKVVEAYKIFLSVRSLVYTLSMRNSQVTATEHLLETNCSKFNDRQSLYL